MAQEVGTLISSNIENGTSKAGKPWTKMTFVIETADQKPRKVAFDTFFGKTIEFISDTNRGTVLKVEYFPESREWNGKWFSNINARNVEVYRQDTPVYNNDHRGIQQMEQMHGQQYSRPQSQQFDDPSNDLPF